MRPTTRLVLIATILLTLLAVVTWRFWPRYEATAQTAATPSVTNPVPHPAVPAKRPPTLPGPKATTMFAQGPITAVLAVDLTADRKTMLLLDNGYTRIKRDGMDLDEPNPSTLRTMDARTGIVKVTCDKLPSTGERSNVYRVAAISPDGKYIAAAGRDAFLWDAATGKHLRSLPANIWNASQIAFSPDSKRLYLAADGLYYWNLDDPANPPTCHQLKTETVPPSVFTFSPDGKRVAIGGSMFSLGFYIHEVEHPETYIKVDAPATGKAMAFSPDGKFIASGPRLFDAHTGKLLVQAECEGGVTALAFSSDGKRLLTGNSVTLQGGGMGKKQIVRVWEAATMKPLMAWQGHDYYVEAATFAGPDDSEAITYAADKSIHIWEVANPAPEAVAFAVPHLPKTDKPLWETTVQTWLFPQLTLTADGSRALVSGLRGKPSAILLDTKTGKPVEGVAVPDGAIRISPDGKCFAGYADNAFIVWDLQKCTELARNTDRVGGSHLTYSPDGKFLANGMSGMLRVFDAQTLKPVMTVGALTEGGAQVDVLTFSPDGKLLAVSRGQWVEIWDLETKQTTKVGRIKCFLAQALAFSPDSTKLAIAPGQKPAIVVDVQTGKTLQEFRDLATVVGIDWSPDGKRILAAGKDELVAWNLADAQRVGELVVARREVSLLAVTPDAKHALTLADGLIRWWDTAPFVAP